MLHRGLLCACICSPVKINACMPHSSSHLSLKLWYLLPSNLVQMQSKTLGNSDGKSNRVPTAVRVLSGLQVNTGQAHHLHQRQRSRIQYFEKQRVTRFLVKFIRHGILLRRWHQVAKHASKSEHQIESCSEYQLFQPQGVEVSGLGLLSVYPEVLILLEEARLVQHWEQWVGKFPITGQEIIGIAPSREHRSTRCPFWQTFWRLVRGFDRSLLTRLILSWTLRCTAARSGEDVLHESNGR